MAPRKKASVSASTITARATRSSVRQGTASLEEATIAPPAQTRTRSRALSSSAPSVSSNESEWSLLARCRAGEREFLSRLTKTRLVALVGALLVEDQQQEQQIGQLEAKVEQMQKEMEKTSAPSPANKSPAVVVSAPADEQPTDTTTTIAPASPASPANDNTTAAPSAWAFLTTPLRKIFSLSPIAEEASSSESSKRSASETDEERNSKRTKMSAPEPVASPAKETPTRRSVKIARQQREARRLAAQYKDSPAPAINSALAPKSRPTLVPSSPRPQQRKSPSPPPKPADTLPSPPKPAVVDVVSKKRKRVKIDDLQAIPSRRPGQSSGCFALLDDFFDLDEDSVEMDEDEVELYMARPAKMARTEHNIFDMSSAHHNTTSPKAGQSSTESLFPSPPKAVSPAKDAQDAQSSSTITTSSLQDVRTGTQSPLKDVRTSTQPITFTSTNPVSPFKDAQDAQPFPPTAATPVKDTYDAEEFDFATPAQQTQDKDALTRKRSEAEKYKPAVGSRLREMQRISNGSSGFGSPSQDIAAQQSPSYITGTPVVQQETYTFPASEPLSADILEDNYFDLSSPSERYSFPATQPLMSEAADVPLSPLPTRWSFPTTQPIFA
ncbi:hypothetical protein MBLNU457_4393t1 [Dothideomycetes sp. NU457]